MKTLRAHLAALALLAAAQCQNFKVSGGLEYRDPNTGAVARINIGNAYQPLSLRSGPDGKAVKLPRGYAK